MNKPLNSEIRKIFATRLKSLVADYQLPFSEQCKAMNIPYNTMQKYIRAISDCSITNLSIIADYYGVSTDFLLGITECKTINNNIRSICDYTGLTDENVINLHRLKGLDAEIVMNSAVKGVFNGLYDYIYRQQGELCCHRR